MGARARRQGQLRRASTPARLLAARRLLDDPKAVWRVVGGLGLAGFVAGALAVLPSITAVDTSQDPQGAILMDDLVTARWSLWSSRSCSRRCPRASRRRRPCWTGAARSRCSTWPGTPAELHDAVRRRIVLVPLLFVAVGSAVTALVMFFPLLGVASVLHRRVR